MSIQTRISYQYFEKVFREVVSPGAHSPPVALGNSWRHLLRDLDSYISAVLTGQMTSIPDLSCFLVPCHSQSDKHDNLFLKTPVTIGTVQAGIFTDNFWESELRVISDFLLNLIQKGITSHNLRICAKYIKMFIGRNSTNLIFMMVRNSEQCPISAWNKINLPL